MAPTVEDQLKDAVGRVVRSQSLKKLVVASPGTGKTTLFKQLLKSGKGDADTRIVLTFINNLKTDLERSLSDFAKVFTLHGYCQSLLRRQRATRPGLTANFHCLPGLASLIKGDWTILKRKAVPQFIGKMRNLEKDEDLEFYLSRANYYDAVDFDDSVFRVYRRFKDDPTLIQGYDLVLIDEYQDFNRMEAEFIDILSTKSPIVIAGDDDQALYSQLRGSSWDFIRSLHRGDDYEKFVLPFCMRCPEVIVAAVNDIMETAQRLKKLIGRIDKPYRHFAPAKGEDSKLYPKIDLVRTSVQRGNANYFGRYIEKAIQAISKEEIEIARGQGEPAVLIIGAIQYLRQVVGYLRGAGYAVSTRETPEPRLTKEIGYELLRENPESSLGWRIVLEFEDNGLKASIIQKAAQESLPIIALVPPEIQGKVALAVRALAEQKRPGAKPHTDEGVEAESPLIKATSFEGSKGMSAQHVFIIGMHEGDLPRDRANIQDLEICRFVVGLTRARKKCSLLHTGRFANEIKRPSPFLSWIREERYNPVMVNAQYWEIS